MRLNDLNPAWICVRSGWVCYTAALCTPAVDYSIMGLDSSISGTYLGYVCLWECLKPINWAFSPFILVCFIANVVMLVGLLHSWSLSNSRFYVGLTLLVFFGLTLLTPFYVQEISCARIGCVMWMLSFLLSGLGFVMTAYPRETGFSISPVVAD